MAGSKYDVSVIVADHVGTLVDARTGRRRRRDYLAQFGLPIALGVLAGGGIYVGKVNISDFNTVTSGVAILTGFLFGLAMFSFQLRLSVTQDPRLSQAMTVKQRLDELFRNVSYAVVAGLFTTVILMGFSAIPYNHPWWRAVRAGIIIVLVVHLVVVILMCLKRLRGAYRALH